MSTAHSSIESTFQSLPPEIRNEIYGYLFGKQWRLKLIYKGYRIIYAIKQADQSEAHESTSTLKPLFGYYVGLRHHAAILRTCRQIYQEAASILYGSTVFSFSKIVDVMWIKPGYEPCSFPAQCLQHVQKLKVYVDYDEPQYTSWRAERIGYLIKEAGALRELLLSFHIGQLWATGDDIDTWTQIMLYKSGIFEVLKASRSLRKVHVRVSNTRDLDVARYFERLVHAITTTEDWSCEHDHEPLVKAKDRVDEDGNLWKDDEYGHKWTWDLRPNVTDYVETHAPLRPANFQEDPFEFRLYAAFLFDDLETKGSTYNQPYWAISGGRNTGTNPHPGPSTTLQRSTSSNVRAGDV